MDFNFFESYKKPKDTVNIFKISVIILTVLIFGGLGLMTMYNALMANTLRNEIEGTRATLNKPEFNQQFSDLDKRELELKAAENIVKYFRALNVAVESVHTVRTATLDYLTDTIPDNVAVNSFAISGISVNVSGSAIEKTEIASYEESLRNINKFDNIGVLNIDRVTETNEENKYSYKYTLNFKINDLDTNSILSGNSLVKNTGAVGDLGMDTNSDNGGDI